jgi:hypothetical protein
MNINHGFGFYYEGEEIEESNDSENPNPTTTTPTPTPPPLKTFTQDEVNTLLAREKRSAEDRGRKQNEKLIKEYEALRKNAATSEEEKTRLETRIEDLKNEYLTQDELRKKNEKAEKEKQKTEKEELIGDRNRWKNMYEQSTIDREIVDAAIKGEAYNPEQILNQLKPNTRLVEELDEENRPTGRFVSKVRLAGKDKDGKPTVFDLTPTDAVKMMKEMPDLHGNLFKSGAHSGLGSNNNATYSRGSNVPPYTDAAAYRKWRNDQKVTPARR